MTDEPAPETVEQRSEEWYRARLGCATASRIKDVMAKARSGSGESASRRNYRAELVLERLTGVPADNFQSEDMEWGTDTEAQARASYILETGNTIQEVGFIRHPLIANAGASPDGLVEADGGVEIKCPKTATHMQTLLGGKIDRPYVLQMQFQMACTGRGWWDFVSFDPRMPDEMRLHIRRIERDPQLISEMEKEVEHFLADVDATVKALIEKYGGTDAAD
jgi:putative phage-type endonuclease